MNVQRARVVGPQVKAARPPAKKALETVGRVTGTQAARRFNPAVVATDIRTGVVGSIPGDALFASQRYRRGELEANEYVADVLNTSLGFGAWTLGAAAVGALLAPVGLPVFLTGVAGFAAGMVSNEIWNRTIGPSATAGIAAGLPAAQAEPVADAFCKLVANPLHDWLWKPVSGFVKKHKVLSGVAAGALALRFPVAAKAIGKEMGTMAGGVGLAMGANSLLLDRWLPSPEAKR